MPRFKPYDYSQSKLLPVSFKEQILPGTFEHSLCCLIDNELDLSIFHERYRNDEVGRPAYDPAILLKVILLGYSRGITSSRRIAALCEQNVLFMAVSADSHPHFTTVADFVSSCHEEIAGLFRQVVLVCYELGLIGGELFAIDGCKLPSNASKEWSGTRADLRKKRKKVDRAVRRILKKHREADRREEDEDIVEREKRQVSTLRKASRKIRDFLSENDEKIGASGQPIQSNITDNESAKMKTSHGVIQGYIGVAGVDAKHQVVVHAEAHGKPQEHELLKPAVEGIRKVLQLGRSKKDALRNAKVIADSGYHSKKNVEYLVEHKVDGYVADTGYRSRDERFKSAKRHWPKERVKPKKRFVVEDFDYDLKEQTCRCPAGKWLWLRCARVKIGNTEFMQFQARESDCNHCELRNRCLRSDNQRAKSRQVNIRLGTIREGGPSALEQMRRKIDSVRGRHIYSHRLGIVEPVFGHITDAIGIKRFSLRGAEKVSGQWRLMTMIHNIVKIHRYGWSLA
jgi:transposase